MSKKNKVTLTIFIIVVIFSVFLYWLYFSKPTSFPTNEQIVQEINTMFPKAKADVIQDTIFLDDRHVYIPFISERNDYGYSYWKWHFGDWKIARIETSGSPNLWKIKESDPSTYHITWNIHPNDKLTSNDFYLMKERNFQVSENYSLFSNSRLESYSPKIQMKQTQTLQEKSYGTMQLPDEWVSIIKADMKLDVTPSSNLFFMYMGHDQFYIGWKPHSQNVDDSFPGHSLNGSIYSNLNIDVESIRFVNGPDLE